MKDIKRQIYSNVSDEWLKLFERNLLNNNEVKSTVINEGYLLPLRVNKSIKKRGLFFNGGCVDHNLSFVAGLIRNDKHDASHTVYGGYEFDPTQVSTIDETVIFGGIIDTHFGHFVLDCLSRLWFKVKNPSMKHKWAFIPIKNEIIPEYFYTFMELLGICRDDIIIVQNITSYKETIVPEQSLISFEYAKPEFLSIYETIVKNCGDKSSYKFKKVYLTRTALNGQSTGVCLGEEYFEEFYSKQGYKVISPEKLSLREQISIIHNCDEVVCTMGTLSHFCLFMKNKSKITILTRAKTTLKPQAILLKIVEEKNIEFNIVDVSMNFIFDKRNQGVYLLGPNEQWRRFAKDEYGVSISDEFNGDLIINYFKGFYERFKDPKNYAILKDLSFFDILNNFSLIFDGKRLDRSNYSAKTISEQLKEEVESLKCKNKMLELKNTNYIKAVQSSLETPVVLAKFHRSSIGWSEYDLTYQLDNYMSHDLHRIEAFVLKTDTPEINLSYSSYVNELGWLDMMSEGEISGTVGKKMPIRSFKCICKSSKYSIKYRCIDKTQKWSNWYSDGDFLPIQKNNELFGIEWIITPKQ